MDLLLTRGEAIISARNIAKKYVEVQLKSAAAEVYAASKFKRPQPFARSNARSKQGILAPNPAQRLGFSRHRSLYLAAKQASKTAQHAAEMAHGVRTTNKNLTPKMCRQHAMHFAKHAIPMLASCKHCLARQLNAADLANHLVLSNYGRHQRLPSLMSAWDRTLSEAMWMAKDFAEEQKWRVCCAHRVSIRAQCCFAKGRIRSIISMHLLSCYHRVMASRLASAVRKFWLRIASKCNQHAMSKRHSRTKRKLLARKKDRRITSLRKPQSKIPTQGHRSYRTARVQMHPRCALKKTRQTIVSRS
jgi:hypothetical protein